MFKMKTGEVIGKHSGALFFTIGERHGFTITKKSDKETPLYVIAKGIEKNTIIVAHKHFERSSKMLIEKVSLSDTNFIGKISNKNLSCRVQIPWRKNKM